jgi:hypothetical protein
MLEEPVLLRVATAPKAIMRDAEFEDQALAASLVSQVVSNFHVGPAIIVRNFVAGEESTGTSKPTWWRRRSPRALGQRRRWRSWGGWSRARRRTSVFQLLSQLRCVYVCVYYC